jgi:membrane protein YqaA with SNARE-associated domain
MGLASHRNAIWFLSFIAFIESSFFPIPPDIMLIPMILAVRQDAWKIAFFCMISSVLGGIGGYGIGYYFFELIGSELLEIYNYGLKFDQFQSTYDAWGAWVVFFAGLTFFPYKVITILSGVMGLNLPIFIISSILARGIRFFVIAWLLWKFGDMIQDFIYRRLGVIFIVFCLLLISGFIIIKFI